MNDLIYKGFVDEIEKCGGVKTLFNPIKSVGKKIVTSIKGVSQKINRSLNPWKRKSLSL